MPSGHRPQPPVGTARVAIQGIGGASNPWANVVYLNLTATSHVLADLKAVVDNVVNNYHTQFGPQQHSACQILSSKATWLYAAGNAIEYTGSYSLAGTHAGSNASDAMCSVIDWSINDYYRGGHPRTYLPGLPDSQVNNGRVLAGAYSSALAIAANAWLTYVNALTSGGISAVALGTVRFASGNAWLSPPVFRAYQSASIRQVLGNQRRRLAA